MTFQLSADERRLLVEALPNERETLADWVARPDDADWLFLEETIGEILAERALAFEKTWPHRGNTDYELHGRQETTQANEIGRLTPKPIAEHVPGAWNFEEPRPGVHPFVELAEKNLRDRRNR